MNALRAALRIFSGKKILNFGFQESLRTFLKPIFTGRGLGSEHHMLSLAPCVSRWRGFAPTSSQAATNANKISANYGQSERSGHLNLYPYKKRLPHAMHSSPFEKLFLRNAPP